LQNSFAAALRSFDAFVSYINEQHTQQLHVSVQRSLQAAHDWLEHRGTTPDE
jgi:hypothetical protein